MKTNPALSLATLFTTLLITGEALVAQQSESKPAGKPFHLTHYDKRIPADSWMLVSMDFDAFLSSKEFLKAAFENSDSEDAPPKAEPGQAKQATPERSRFPPLSLRGA